MEKKLKEEKDAPTVVEKKIYKTPKLFIYGSVKELTNSGSGFEKEDSGRRNPFQHP